MAVNPLSGRLQEILTAKLSAGNKICETWTGDWPFPGSKIIIWKADYCDVGNQEIRSVAASALGAYLAQHQVPPTFKGWNRYTVPQGSAMGWPSVIHSEI